MALLIFRASFDTSDIEITLNYYYYYCYYVHPGESINCGGSSQGVHSLVDKILAKFEQLDSGKFGTVGTPAFNAKCSELAVLFSHEPTLSKTVPASSSTSLQAAILQALKSTFQI